MRPPSRTATAAPAAGSTNVSWPGVSWSGESATIDKPIVGPGTNRHTAKLNSSSSEDANDGHTSPIRRSTLSSHGEPTGRLASDGVLTRETLSTTRPGRDVADEETETEEQRNDHYIARFLDPQRVVGLCVGKVERTRCDDHGHDHGGPTDNAASVTMIASVTPTTVEPTSPRTVPVSAPTAKATTGPITTASRPRDLESTASVVSLSPPTWVPCWRQRRPSSRTHTEMHRHLHRVRDRLHSLTGRDHSRVSAVSRRRPPEVSEPSG